METPPPIEAPTTGTAAEKAAGERAEEDRAAAELEKAIRGGK